MEYAKISTPSLCLLLLVTFCASIHAAVRNPETLTETLPAYALTGQLDVLNSSRCRTQMQEFRDGVDRAVVWSLRLLDASGVPSAGFIDGNDLWLGNRQQCGFLAANTTMMHSEKVTRNNSMYRNEDEEFPPFDIRFVVAHMHHNSTLQYHLELPGDNLVTLGLCLPASCTLDEITRMLKKVLDDRTLLVEQLYSADFTLLDVSDVEDDHRWLLSGKIITIILVLVILVSMSIVGTLYDVIVYQKRLQKKREFLTCENNNTSEMKHDMEERRENNREEIALSELKPENGLEQLLVSFSFYSNLSQIFKVDGNSEGVPALHGLKFFGMMWIVMAHTIYYTDTVIANKVTAFLMSSTFMSQILSNATLSVDTFFFMSGFLLTYIFLKAQKKQKWTPSLRTRVSQFFLSLFKRFFRLTPAYFVVILIAILNFSWHERITLFHYVESVTDKCSKYWWMNILYINNLFDWNDVCLSWSWYLSNDMQFFLFGSFLLILSSTHYFTALGLGVATLAVSISLNAYLAYSLNYTLAMHEQYALLTQLYLRPWLRIPPYLIGMGTAQLLTKWNYKLNLSRKALTACWILGIMCNCSILFGIAQKPVPLGLSVLYTALSRTGWGVGLAWLVIACCTNNAGIVNKFLSLPVWVPLSRLTYCAYLLNPFLILSICLLSAYPIFIDFLTTGSMFLGMLVISYVCAIPLSLLSEVPVILFLRTVGTKRRAK